MANPVVDFFRFAGAFLKLIWISWFSKPTPLMGGVIDEQIRLLLRIQELMGEKPLPGQTPAQAREHFNALIPSLKSIGGLFEKVDTIRDLQIPGPAGIIPARLYQMATDRPLPLMLYFHGGGWVIGNIDTADNIARFICRRAGCHVLSIDYRLAPEFPFPAAVEDSFAALEWAHEHTAELGADPARILAGGDSAGGNLTAVIAQLTVRKGKPTLAGQVLFYAAVDGAHLDTPSYKKFGGQALGLPMVDVEWFLDHYVPNINDREDPRLSPLLENDLRGLPPALVVTAEFDVLRDEAEAYAERLKLAGVKVALMRCNGMNHGFLTTVGLIRRSEIYFGQIAEQIKLIVSAGGT
jgi:acetyl esterase/lipase